MVNLSDFVGFALSVATVLCKSNANEVRRNSSFVLVNFPRKVVEFSKDFS